MSKPIRMTEDSMPPIQLLFDGGDEAPVFQLGNELAGYRDFDTVAEFEEWIESLPEEATEDQHLPITEGLSISFPSLLVWKGFLTSLQQGLEEYWEIRDFNEEEEAGEEDEEDDGPEFDLGIPEEFN